MSKKHVMFILLMCIIGISVLTSVSASDLNETVVSEIDSDVIEVDEIEDTSKELGADNVEVEELSLSKDTDVIATKYTPRNFDEIKTSVENADDGDTIILDGYYLFKTTVTVNKQLTFVGINDATLDGNNSVRLFTAKNVTFKNICFKNGQNTSGYGGAIFFNGAGSVVNCSFVNNSARYGGAIYLSGSGSNIYYSNFTNNTARSNGGAVCSMSDRNPYFIEDNDIVGCIFSDNVAYGVSSPVNNNGGGAVFLYYCIHCTIIDSKFINNAVISETKADGGAILLLNDKDILIDNCTFDGNYITGADNAWVQGGAIFFRSNNVTLSNSVFQNCWSQKEAGAVYLCNDPFNVDSSVMDFIVTNTTFINNTARSEDSYYDRNYGGGAVLLKQHKNVLFNNVTFINNTANTGGALSMTRQRSDSTYFYNCYFRGNEATENGGSFWSDNCPLNIKNITISDGKAGNSGGGVYSNVGINHENVTFTNNSAKYGGALYLNRNSITVKDMVFINNTAEDGGAIYLSQGNSVVNCTFNGNSVSNCGGAVYCGSIQGSVVNCTFNGNSANDEGGAVYCGSIRGSVVNCSFVNNSVDNGSAIYFRSGGSVLTCSFEGHNSNVLHGTSNVLDCLFDVYPTVPYHYTTFLNIDIINREFLVVNLSDIRGPIVNKIIRLNINGTESNINSSNGSVSLKINDYVAKGTPDIFIFNFNFMGDSINDPVSKNIIIFNPNYSSDLQREINNAKSGDTIILDGYYAFDSDTITVDKQLNFIGINNATIDGNNGVRLFSVSNDKVTFKNITFKNGNYEGGYGGAIFFNGAGSVVNCSFVNNSAETGGAVYFSSSGSVVGCSFVNNSAHYVGASYFRGGGGAVFFDSSGGSIVNCSFVNNSADNGGGAIYIKGYGGSVVNCTFNGNSAHYVGAIYFRGGGGSVVNCSFVNNSEWDENTFNSANYDLGGGAIYCSNSGCSIVNCSFVGNSAFLGGAVHLFKGGSVVNCIFINNSAKIAGAMRSGSCVNCSFVNNSAYWYCDAVQGGSCVNCTFKGHTSDVLERTSDILDCLFDIYPTVPYHYTTYLNVNDLTIFNDNALLVANLSNIFGPLFSKVVTFNVNGIDYNVTTDSEGLAYFNIKNYFTEQGSYNVMVSFAGDNIINPVSKNVTVTITNYYTNLDVNNLSAYIGEGILIASLSDMNGQLYDKTITFSFNGVEYNVTTDSDGLAKFNIGEYLKAHGSYDINVIFEGDDFNSPVSAIAHVVIKRYNSVLDVGDLSIIQGEDGFLIVRLSDSRGVLTNKTITLTINNVNYYNTTDSNGTIRFNVKDYLTELGKYNATISFLGDEYNNPISANATILINALKANLTVVQEGKYYNDTNLTFRLVNLKTNEPISDALIHVVFSNGQTASIFTDSDGFVSYQVPFEPGIYSASASVLNIDYSDINTVKLNDFIVSKFIGQIDVYQGDDCRILKVRLYNPETGYVFKKFNVTLSFDTGKIVDVMTDEEGIATYNMPFEIGTYSVNASVSMNNAEFDSVNLNNIIINNKENSEVIFSCGDVLEINYNETGSIFAGVKGGRIYEGNISVNNPDAIISMGQNNVIYISGLNAGNYILRVITTPDENHNSITRSVNVKVNKINSAIKFNNEISFDYGNSGFTTVDLEGCSISKENMYVIGHPDAVIDFDGSYVSVSNLSAGSYTLCVYTTPDANHNPVNCNVSVHVNKVESDISFNENINFNYNETGYINVKTTGCSFKRDNISVDGHPEAIIRVSSNMISISNLTVGNYTLNVVTAPDVNHESVSRSVGITVNELSSFFNFKRALSFSYGGHDITFLTDFRGCIVEYENICVVDHPEAIISYENDEITVSNLTSGDYILSAKSTPEKNYKSLTRTISINVNKIDSKVTLTKDISFDYLKSGTTSVVVDGGSIANISIVGHPEANITLVDNEIIVSNLTAGDYVLSVVTLSDENHNSVTVNKSFTVNRIGSSIAFNSPEVTFDQGGFGTVDVTVIGGDVDENLTIVEDHPEAVINVTGNVISVSNLTAGTYIMRVSSNPDENHKPAIRSINVIVNKVKSSVSFTNDITFDYGGFGTTAINVTGGFVLTKDIQVLNQEAIITMDNNNVITVSGLDSGNYILSIVTTPDESHRLSETRINITVNRITSKIILDDEISFDYGSYGSVDVNVEGGSILTANVVDYPNADVRFGSDKISVSNLDAGEYMLNITTAPDKNHYSVSKTVSFKVNKVLSSISFSGNITFDYLGTGSAYVIVTGGSLVHDNISVIGQKANIDLANNLISVSGLNAGKYVLSCNITPDKNHKVFEGKLNITVNRINSIVSATSFSFDYLKSGSTLVVVDGGSVSREGVNVVGYPNALINVKNNRITVSGLNPGIYTLHIKSSPDNNHISSEIDVEITVNRVNAAIKVSSQTVALKKSTLWTVQVTANGKGIAGVNVVLKVYTGKKYRTVIVKTNAHGVASFNTKGLSKGSHKVVASISHIGYVAREASATIKVIKQTKLNFKVKKNVGKDGSSLSITVKNGKKHLNGVKIKLLIYTGKKLTKTVILKSKKNGKYSGVCGWGTNRLTAGNHKIIIKPVKLKYSGSKTVNLKIRKSALKHPRWESKI